MSRPFSAWTRTFWGSQELKLPLFSRQSWPAGCLWTPPTELAEFRRSEVPQAYSMPVQAGILFWEVQRAGLFLIELSPVLLSGKRSPRVVAGESLPDATCPELLDEEIVEASLRHRIVSESCAGNRWLQTFALHLQVLT